MTAELATLRGPLDATMTRGGDDPVDAPAWERTVDHGAGSHAASWLDASDGLSILLGLAQQYRDAG